MNYKMIFYSIGHLLKVEAVLLVLPLIVSFIYKENTYLSFLIPIIALLLVGFLLTIKKPKKKTIYAKEGFITVGLSWIIVSLFGCLPFIISQEIPSFIDAFFETVSGFTTTGASILTQPEDLTMGMLFWRSFTHWIGGMGILVFILAILPTSEAHNIYILRAESPGPQVGKLVSKVRFTARILYYIYFGLTFIQVILLLCGGMPFFDSLVNTFATAGTGGFTITSNNIAMYSQYSQIVIGIFMLLFGLNFNIFYLLLIGNIKQVLKSEEMYWYFGIVIVAITMITINIFTSPLLTYSLGESILNAFFQVSSIITTTGFATADFNLWPVLSQVILIILMFIGACAGSTGGGLKISRIVILFKTMRRNIKKLLHPRSISNIRFEKTTIDESLVSSISSYFTILIAIFVACLVVVSFDKTSFMTNFSAVSACINNVGPGFDMIGPFGSYGGFSVLSKSVLIFAMLIGRLEIFPILLLFSPKVWLNK